MDGFVIKQYEETLDFYKKENFNLKVRIYLLEEKNEQICKKCAVSSDKYDNGFEQKIMEENEILQKKLKDNNKLLRYALDVLNLLDKKSVQNIVKNNLEPSSNECIELFVNAAAEPKDLPILNETKTMVLETDTSNASDLNSLNGKSTLNDIISNDNVIYMEHIKQIDNLQKRVATLEDELTNEKNRTIEMKKVFDSYNDLKAKLEKLLIENEEQKKLITEKDIRIQVLQQEREQYESKDFIENNEEYKRISCLLKENITSLDRQANKINELKTRNIYLEFELKRLEEVISNKDKTLMQSNEKNEDAMKQVESCHLELDLLSRDFRKAISTIDEYKRKINVLTKEGDRHDSNVVGTTTKNDFSENTSKDLIAHGNSLSENVDELIKENEKLREFGSREIETRETKIRLLEIENSRALDLIRDFLIYESQTSSEKNNLKKRNLNTKWTFLLSQKEHQIAHLEHELTNLLKTIKISENGKDSTQSTSRTATASPHRK